MNTPNTVIKITTAIVGASGYTGEELCKILSKHPYVQLTVVTSRQKAGKKLAHEIPGFSPGSPLCLQHKQTCFS
jgi:N-acetyl-gamma-glutamyl-phosphate reductase